YSRTASLLRRSQLLGILIAAISLALLAWIIIRLFEKLINRPIMLLKDRMAQVRQGKLDLSFPAVKQDEIGTLTQHFHHMVESLKKANHKIEELHRKEIERAEHLAAFGEMAAGLAHEIKNPLAGIRGALEVIHQRTNGKDPKKEIFQEMLYQIDKIKHILEDLLSYARPKEPKFRLIHPNICVEDALKLAKTQVGNKDIRFDFKGLDNGAQARIDPDRIQELMLNLIMNSISAIEKKGTIRIRLDSDNRDGLLITISDDGKGIEKKHLPKIFQPFFTTKPKGTGLGLSICKKIVESHNGSITVRSEPGKGTTFFIYLPVLERSINHEAEKNPRRG
ncbi:MAG: PAS domain-containing sensor histidine kinase, partial [Candidatus Aminicenantales bacterium]